MDEVCKICNSKNLKIVEHTALCRDCDVLLYYPYPRDDKELIVSGEGKQWTRDYVLDWYEKSSFLNHSNFTDMLRFTMGEQYKGKIIDVLDYGGGGGQFALVCKSHFPQAQVYIVDISDEALLQEWSSINNQIKFEKFDQDERKFDVIFMNDVFEHVSDPVYVLNQLSKKLKTGGRIFIDTPKQFWIYPFFKIISKYMYNRILRGTVSLAHLQIWSKKSFVKVVAKSCLKILKYEEVSEYTMPADFYLRNMGISNSILKFGAYIFYANSWWLAKNKIQCVLMADDS